ncbi:MAG: CDP-alcohol phosphatidyltransferase family protein [Chloroflexota bacterium]
MPKLVEIRKYAADSMTRPVARVLAKTSVSPDALSWTGFGLTLVAGGFVIFGQLLIGGIAMLCAGFFDMLDGAVARMSHRTTSFGAILDSTLDRLAEATMLLCLMVFFAREGSLTGVVLSGITLTASFMVSYVRARAEGMGLESREGFFTRPERVGLLALGLLLGQLPYALPAALVVIAFFSTLTAAQRLVNAWRQTRDSSTLK